MEEKQAAKMEFHRSYDIFAAHGRTSHIVKDVCQCVSMLLVLGRAETERDLADSMPAVILPGK